MGVSAELRDRRASALRAWSAFVEHGDTVGPIVRSEIFSSWQRSRAADTLHLAAAPLADEAETRAFWRASPLQTAVGRVEDDLRRTADDGDLVLAITDADTRILWTYGGRVMRHRAESVNFVPSARWDDASVGTNALDLAQRHAAPAMVFSAEHFVPIVHNWVCWAAPVHDPATGRQLGVVDISTTWDRTHPIGLATARVLASLIQTALPPGADAAPTTVATTTPGLTLRLLGRSEIVLDGRPVLLTRRQTEILALLALHPDGLSLAELHAALYGDAAVSRSTLKAEVSHLRRTLDGQVASRPYRLLMPVRTDVEEVLDHLRRGRALAAVQAYGGDLLPGTDSPALVDWGQYVAVAVREALLADPDPTAVLRYSELAPYDIEVLQVCLARRTGIDDGVEATDATTAMLKARLVVAQR